jgi:hypothetical protein
MLFIQFPNNFYLLNLFYTIVIGFYNHTKKRIRMGFFFL